MTFELRPFDPKTATKAEWACFHVFRRARHRETDPDDPDWDNSSVEGWLRQPDPQNDDFRFVARDPSDPETIRGMLTLSIARKDSPSYAEKRNEAFVELEVLEPYRREGIGTHLLREALRLAEEHERTLLVGNTQEEDGKAFLKAVGAHFARPSKESRLSLKTLDWQMVERWAEQGPHRSPGSTLSWFGNRMDEEYLKEYAELFTEVLNDAPRDELKIGDHIVTPQTLRDWEARFDASGGQSILAVSVEVDGALSGMTEMGYWPERKTVIQQFLTGVRRPYRGRGLGKWLKAAMLLRVRKDLPQVDTVLTDNATTNAAMLAINERMGFQVHKEWETVQMSREELMRWLAMQEAPRTTAPGSPSKPG